jgi:osmotically-inducible protein OsmY
MFKSREEGFMKMRSVKYEIGTVILLSLVIVFLATLEAQTKGMDDRGIHIAIVTEMIGNEIVPADSINVEVQDGIVELSGIVYSLLAKEKAMELTRSIKGVRSIIDKIQVKDSGLSDNDIRRGVKRALLLDPATESFDVIVKVQEGSVTLEGKVQSYAEKKLCEIVVKGVKGVTEVVNDTIVLPTASRPDHALKVEIERRLETDVRIDDDLISVDVQNGKVILSGSANSLIEATLAEVMAWVEGVEEVDTEDLKIDLRKRDDMWREHFPVLDDSQVREAVMDALDYDPRIVPFDLDVYVEDGDVILTGVVDNLKAKMTAGQDAKNTIGVRRVINHLKVRPVKDKSDQEILKAVKTSLSQDPFVDRHALTISVFNGKVHLYGTVDSEFEKLRAEDIASKNEGVIGIKNSLNVYSDVNGKSDRVLEEDIENTLFWSPFIDDTKISVRVEDGIATLSGKVETWFAYNLAQRKAIKAGARGVVNNLEKSQE